uniref:Eukaryotic peptide chain release factor subunit 1 n=1 Tax=Dermatophagoides pteronyssinus TaxID=6956 RepID=A0A6P6YJM0_DERPT
MICHKTPVINHSYFVRMQALRSRICAFLAECLLSYFDNHVAGALFRTAMADAGADNFEIEEFKIKRLIKALSAARGNGTSVITLIVKARDDISRIGRLLTEEAGTASNIKSRVNRLSVLSAIASAAQKVKTYSRTPPNGLLIFCGSVLNADGKERKLSIAIELVECVPLDEWIIENYKSFGVELCFVTDASQEGSQFVKGFGGIGAVLRYKVE